jgi:phosphatidylglycerophosphate synthase
MLDSRVRRLIDKPLNLIGVQLDIIGITANSMTVFGFFCGIFSILSIANDNLSYGLFFLCLNRLADGLDGAVARASKLSDFGGFLDIVSDFIIYSGVIFAFAFRDPSQALYSTFLIFSFIGPIASFLAYAIIAAKKDINTEKRGKKSFYYLGGICEGTETAFILILICLVPSIFAEVCIVYGILCWITTAGRVYAAWSDFSYVK